MKRLRQYFEFIRQINVWQYIYLNYFSKSVIREDRSHILPYWHAVIELETSSTIRIKGGDLEIGSDRLKHSKAETLVRLRENASWESVGGCRFVYGTSFEVLKGAAVKNGYFSMNCGSSVVSANKLVIGHDVMIARNVVVYDSDFHPILDRNGNAINGSSGTVIGDHVWIGTGSIVLKNSYVGNNVIIGAGSIINGRIKDNVILINTGGTVEKDNDGTWKRC